MRLDCAGTEFRAVAQLGSALVWGTRGRGFKSRQPDQVRATFRSGPAVFFAFILRDVKSTRKTTRRSGALEPVFRGSSSIQLMPSAADILLDADRCMPGITCW